MYILYPFEKKRWCLCERDGGKSFENEKSFFNSWKIVRHCFRRQGFVLQDTRTNYCFQRWHIHTLTQWWATYSNEAIKGTNFSKNKQKLFCIESSYLYYLFIFYFSYLLFLYRLVSTLSSALFVLWVNLSRFCFTDRSRRFCAWVSRKWFSELLFGWSIEKSCSLANRASR